MSNVEQANISKSVRGNQKGDTEAEHWDTVITPRASLLDLKLKETWRYRDLMFMFVKRDFVAKYKQTILGPIWHIIQPVLTSIMFLILFGRIARIPTDGIQPSLFYLSGITLWLFFASCLTNTSNTFINNAPIFGKVYFPRLVIPLSIVISNCIQFVMQFLLIAALMIYHHFHGFPVTITPALFYIPFLVMLLAGIGLGLGIIISSLTTKYRDISVLLTFAVQLAMFMTPVAYPLSYLQGGGWFGAIIRWNPVSPVLEAFRYALFGKGTFDVYSLGYSVAFMVVVLLFGIVFFNKVERDFMDTV